MAVRAGSSQSRDREWDQKDGGLDAPGPEEIPVPVARSRVKAPQALRSKEAAARLGVSVRTLEDWRHKRTGPPFHRLGTRLVVYYEHELATWMESRSAWSG